MQDPPIPRDGLTIARILKVNHAGEHGAIRIYRAQIAVSRRLYPDLVAPLSAMLSHEIRHHAVFLEAMPARAARPCRIMSLWSIGGSILGLTTALIGRQSIWTTTAAVEAAVHRHLDDQLHYLATRDRALFDAISDIREEELQHLREAEAHIQGPSLLRTVMRAIISTLTDILIWLSTWGDSSRMARELAAAGARRG